MSCYRPLKAFFISLKINKDDEIKERLKITGYEVDHIEDIEGQLVKKYTSDSLLPPSRVFRDFYEIPCGKCIGCRSAYTKQWADRCMLELSQHKSSYFVTLTYDDVHLPMKESHDHNTGEIRDLPTLVKAELSAFMKRLRKNTGQELRFYGCGEYGSQSFRPHYHVIIFGLELDDLVFYSYSDGNPLYNSQTIDQAWHYQGHAVVGAVTYDSCAYVAGYVNKKLYGRDKAFYEDLEIEPEFTLMSRRPGIGGLFYEDNKDYDYSTFNSFFVPDHKVPVPRYFLRKLKSDDPELYDDVKKKKLLVSDAIKHLKLSQTDKDYLSMLKAEEDVKLSKVKFKKGGI